MNSEAMEKEGRDERIVSIYMVQIDEHSFTMLRDRGLVDDESVNTYLRAQSGISQPPEPTWEEDAFDQADMDEEDDAVTIDWSIPISQAPRVPPHCVPVADDVYEFLQKCGVEPEKEIARLMRQRAGAIAQSQSRSR